jgi:energy-coupling factor transporter ATP-binding protein EcfA2
VDRPVRSIGYVPERLPTQLRLTAGQYLVHMGRLRGLDRQRVVARSAELLDRLALYPGPDVPIGELSKGNSQKVALAQAFLAPVRLLALDEPDSGLDAAAAAGLAGLIGAARRAGTAVLISTHDPAWFRTADAAFELTAGRLTPFTPPPIEPTASGPVPPGPVPPGSVPPGAAPPGRVGTAGPAAVTRLVLRAGDAPAAIGDGPAAAGVAALPGVMVTGHDPAGGWLELLTADPDAALRWALGHGWSFVRGGPAAPSTPDGGR